MNRLSTLTAKTVPFIVHGAVRISDAAAMWMIAMLGEGLAAVGAIVVYERSKEARARERPVALSVQMNAKPRWIRYRLATRIARLDVDTIPEGSRKEGLVAIRGRLVARVSSERKRLDSDSIASPWVKMTEGDAIVVEDDSGTSVRIPILGMLDGTFVVGSEIFAVGEFQRTSASPGSPAGGPFRGDTRSEEPRELTAGSAGFLLVSSGGQSDAAKAFTRSFVIDPLSLFPYVIILLAVAAAVSGCISAML